MQQVTLLKADFDRVSGEKYLLESDGQRYASNEALAARLVRENEELQSGRRQLQGAVEALQAKVYATQSQLSELADQKQDMSADLARERSLHANLRLEVDELRQIMMADHSAGGGGGGRQGGSGSANVKAAQGEIERKVMALKSEYESNKAALESLQAAHKSLSIAHTKASNVSARVVQEKESLEQDNLRLKKAVTILRKEHAEARDIAALHTEQNGALRAAHDALAADHAHCRRRLPELEAALARSEKQRAALKKQFEECWSTKEDLALQLEEVRAEADLRAKQIDIMQTPAGPSAAERNAQGELALMQAERVSLVKQVEELQQRREALERSLADSDASLQRWQAKYEAAAAEKSALSKELEDAEAESKRMAAAIKAAASGEQDGKDAMQAALRDAQSQLAAASSASQADLAAARKGAADAAAAAAASESAAAAARDALAAQARTHAAELAELKRKADEFLTARLAEAERAATATSKALMAAQHRTAELEAVLDQPRLSAPDLAKLARREAELQATVAKLIVNEEASEASFTCFACLAVFTKPVTCIPCGHSYCLSCIEQTHTCTQCRPAVKVTYYANELLEELCSRFVFRKQALQTLKDMTAQSLVKS